MNSAQVNGPGDPLTPASNRVLDSLAAVLRGYQLDPGQEIHAMRMLRSLTHGFTTLEAESGFQLGTDVDDSFTWLISFIDHGLRAAASARARSAPRADKRQAATTVNRHET